MIAEPIREFSDDKGKVYQEYKISPYVADPITGRIIPGNTHAIPKEPIGFPVVKEGIDKTSDIDYSDQKHLTYLPFAPPTAELLTDAVHLQKQITADNLNPNPIPPDLILRVGNANNYFPKSIMDYYVQSGNYEKDKQEQEQAFKKAISERINPHGKNKKETLFDMKDDEQEEQEDDCKMKKSRTDY